MESANGWLISHYIACAERKLSEIDKIESITGEIHEQPFLGGEISEIKLFGNNKCNISFYLYDRTMKEDDVLREKDSVVITVIHEGERFIAFTQKEREEISENYEEMLRSISEQGKVYVCGNATGKDEVFNIYARILDWDKGEHETEVVRLERFQRKGKFPLENITLDLDSFCEYYRIASEEERKAFEKNLEDRKEDREI